MPPAGRTSCINRGQPGAPRRRSANLERSERPVAAYRESDRPGRPSTGHGDLGPKLLSSRTKRGIGNVLGNEERDRVVDRRHETLRRRIQPDSERPAVAEDAQKAISLRPRFHPPIFPCPHAVGPIRERHLQPKAYVAAADGRWGSNGRVRAHARGSRARSASSLRPNAPTSRTWTIARAIPARRAVTWPGRGRWQPAVAASARADSHPQGRAGRVR